MPPLDPPPLDDRARWVKPRPAYVRESEPGNTSAWTTQPTTVVDAGEAAFNRSLFREGRNRKPAASCPLSVASETQGKVGS